MPIVDDNRLKGNHGAAVVAARLSSECLVRPVTADTDVGVDLYCETIAEDRPFLHFWVQVKAGKQVRVLADEKMASCSFEDDKLRYWKRQPVPVFAMLVPEPSPPEVEPAVYVINVTRRLLFQPGGSGGTLRSDECWAPGDPRVVQEFLSNVVPRTTAEMQCMRGVVEPAETPTPDYVLTIPYVPVLRFKKEILDQLRITAVHSILFGLAGPECEEEDDKAFRRRLARVVELFDNKEHGGEDKPHVMFHGDWHYENDVARAQSSHADGDFEEAVQSYQEAVDHIRGDTKLRNRPDWQRWEQRAERIRQLQDQARRKQIPMRWSV